MIRATFFLTLALTVATGESAMLICQVVCDRGVEADADACQHAQSAAPVSMSDDGDCLGLGLPVMGAPAIQHMLRNPQVPSHLGHGVSTSLSEGGLRRVPHSY